MAANSASSETTVTVLGAGSWGTALALHCARQGFATALWTRSSEHRASMEAERCNRRYLPDFPFPPGLTPTDDLEAALSHRPRLVICAIPSHGMRPMIRRVRAVCEAHPPALAPLWLIAAKGIEVDTLACMHEVLADELAAGDRVDIAALGGPSFAVEVAAGRPTMVVVAAAREAAGFEIQSMLSGSNLRAYWTEDVLGVELGGALKNVIALAVGIGDGAGLGQNARAGLITRGLAEMTRLSAALGANAATLAGLAGVGDLVLTCTGGLSRNRRVGVALGEGRTLTEILNGLGMVAEGVNNARSAQKLARKTGVDMPLVETIYAILYEELGVPEAVDALMGRRLKAERD